MPEGDLSATSLVTLLLGLGDDRATGCLRVTDAEGADALVHLRDGLVYAVSIPGQRPQLGARLVSSGQLSPEALAEAVEAQRTELQGWRLAELLVHLGFVDQPVVEAFVREQMQDAMWDLVRAGGGRWRFRRNERTRDDVAPPVSVRELLAALHRRQERWERICGIVSGPTAVPRLSAGEVGAPETRLEPDAWSMLCKVDGTRPLAELAAHCGFTLFEAGQVLVSLVEAGLVEVGPGADGPAPLASADRDHSVAQRLISALADDRAARDTPSPIILRQVEDFSASVERVSRALAEMLGPQAEVADPFLVPDELRRIPRRRPVPPPEPADDPQQLRMRRLREAAAAELAAAHAVAEQEHSDADVVRLDDVRRQAERRAAEEAEREQERLRTEQAQRELAARAAEEAERLAADEAERLEAERVQAERLEAERLEAERLEAERLEAERLEAERLEAERLEAECRAAEQAARAAAEPDAWAEHAAREAERAEAERLEAERAEAERLEAERAEAVRSEAERVEAERVEAERVALLEEQARAEVERLAAEAAQTAAATAALSALAVEVSEEPDRPVGEPADAVPGDLPIDEPPAPPTPAADTDTAALLRELSSLGLDDDPAPTAPVLPRTSPSSAARKPKKRGFFSL